MPADSPILPAHDCSPRSSPKSRAVLLLAFFLPLAAFGAQIAQAASPLLTLAALLPSAILLLCRTLPLQNLAGAIAVVSAVASLFLLATGRPVLPGVLLVLAAILTARAAAENSGHLFKKRRLHKTGSTLGFALLPLILWTPAPVSDRGQILAAALTALLVALAVVLTVPWFISKRAVTTPPSCLALLPWLILVVAAVETRLPTTPALNFRTQSSALGWPTAGPPQGVLKNAPDNNLGFLPFLRYNTPDS